ncbi:MULTISPECIES: DUF4112 domain-containing protein [unclassified Microcoleus]|jgi:hypothetical protein|uniref:DUF4112 domain-containing protein n=1 Tax=unclassified Microcoleus TaxID=2642155 RepID=UPI001D4DD25F|nr:MULTISPECIES: DUF4112 domain-containing protein [unclassified Microcoleus]TAE41507.1 MAG: DUF4112 domain-containing protein [Oscillatoriales cyanobacterium]MCC3413151.1 DUF4112 domain-containing protein [Microcoleus sp. PH2017_02_FOX_O_A]MCC3450767.1 DUF4112 domain-containing protein [Microcoleus sp. PH2017_09_SFU_O_A]MCC3456682.1 DUF4112 domain-containing protein [Microcoleus sp. PH2017_08_TRC_O_A]MCC3492341.1 DUF4112 domain-containing protein [Microcoleus sp. PH2017_16_JOR_D_A]
MSRPPIQNSSANTPNKSQAASLRRLRRISHLLDNAIPIPGTKYRIGLDPILGLIPGGGDLVGSIFAGYVVFKSAQMGVPQETLVKMAANIVFDTVAGTVPVAGDLLDVAWKANIKNIELLDAHLGSPEPAGKKADWLFVVALLLGLTLIVGSVIFLSVMFFGWVFKALTGG